MKWLKYALIFLIPLVILLFSFRVYVFDDDYYNQEFVNYDVISNFPLVDSALSNLFNFFQEGEELNFEIFSEREILHLNDVKNIILKILLILNILFILTFSIIAYFMYNKDYHSISFAFIIGGILSLVLSLSIIILSFFSFESFFIRFHELFFSNNLWLLPSDSTLIRMFSQTFFYNITKRIILNSVFLSCFIIVLGVGARYIKEK
jgi:integral membrane protein (TIGR01906 family)